MNRSKLPVFVILITALGALFGALLRVYQLSSCMTETGLIRVGSPILYLLLGYAALVLAILGTLCHGLSRVRGTERCLHASPVYLFADLAGATVVFYGALLRMTDGGGVLFLFGMAAALCLAAAALLYGRKSKAVFWLLLIPCLFFGALLISDFRHWSTDPLVIDFCFRQFAMVCGMLALLHVSAFPLRVGRKRITVFWCVSAVLFAGMVVPDFFYSHAISLGELLIPVGLAVWCAGHALRLLRLEVQTERPEPMEEDAVPELEAVPPLPEQEGYHSARIPYDEAIDLTPVDEES